MSGGHVIVPGGGGFTAGAFMFGRAGVGGGGPDGEVQENNGRGGGGPAGFAGFAGTAPAESEEDDNDNEPGLDTDGGPRGVRSRERSRTRLAAGLRPAAAGFPETGRTRFPGFPAAGRFTAGFLRGMRKHTKLLKPIRTPSA